MPPTAVAASAAAAAVVVVVVEFSNRKLQKRANDERDVLYT